MKRLKQLQLLSKEHHQSLVLAKKCKEINDKETVDSVKEFSQLLKVEFETIWLHHFKVEEKTIFSVAENKSNGINKICKQLKEEHVTLEKMVEKISAGEFKLIHEFGQLLHDHTRLEERQLFPLVEELFTEEELGNILNYNK